MFTKFILTDDFVLFIFVVRLLIVVLYQARIQPCLVVKSSNWNCGIKVRFGVVRRHRGLAKQNRIGYDSIRTHATGTWPKHFIHSATTAYIYKKSTDHQLRSMQRPWSYSLNSCCLFWYSGGCGQSERESQVSVLTEKLCRKGKRLLAIVCQKTCQSEEWQ